MDASESQVATWFAPAGRDGEGELRRQQAAADTAPLLQATLDAMSDVVLILNGHRQVIAVNDRVLELLQCRRDDVLGKRPGELVGCKNATAGPDGCGSSHDCSTCGAVQAILESQQTEDRITRECRICLQEPVGGALDLKVSATAVDVDGERFTICVLKDISDQKRLAVLARLFFHDVMNTAGSIQGFAELLRETTPQDAPGHQELEDLTELAEQLIEEIRAQRDLTYAESGDLQPDFEPVSVRRLLDRLLQGCGKHPVARNRRIERADIWDGTLVTDERLLARVLGNMIKNALEATLAGGRVTVGCQERAEQVVFSVHNATVMPADVQSQVFQRSFSTKAKTGRGIGTHSMRLFGERYLGGRVGFTSREPEGTLFTITLPKSPPPRASEK